MLWTWLVGLALKGTVMTAVVLFLTLPLRRASAAARHFVLFLGIASLLAMPVLAPIAASLASAYAPAVATVAVPSSWTSLTVTADAPGDWRHAVAFGWAAVAVLLVLRVVAAQILVARMARRAIPSASAHGVQVRVSSAVSMPFTCGLLRPVILLPASAPSWPEDRREVVLLHEAAHVVRRDPLARFIAQLGCALHWFNPLAWLATGRMASEQEHACDDWVLAQGVRPSNYAEHLLDIAHHLHGASLWRPAAIPMAHCSQLHARLRSILAANPNRSPLSRVGTVVAIAAVAALVAPLAAIRAFGGASISGSLSDGTGVVPNAFVTLRSPDNSIYTSRTGPSGNYRFAQLNPGRYELRFAAPGFADNVVPVVVIDPDRELILRSVLKLGDVRQHLDVVAQHPTAAAANVPPPKQIRVGGNVQAARLVHQVRPVYPAGAKQAGIQGTVMLRAVIDREGAVSRISLIDSPDPALAEAAIDAVRQWRYTPTWLNGSPVEVETAIAVNYRLTP